MKNRINIELLSADLANLSKTYIKLDEVQKDRSLNGNINDAIIV